MGSRSKIDLAYVAGFLDGDGSLMLQVKKRKDGALKKRFMATICFYQDTRHEKELYWIQQQFGIGYISKRNDGMTELRINGYAQVRNILKQLLPFIRFKRLQARALYSASKLLSEVPYKKLSEKQLRQLAALILIIQNENYATKTKKSEEELLTIFGLTP
ncbi:MAG TPA: LAGLIDADG family homing endonuclease [Candidatus Paceibacterota bacterium]